MAIPRGLTDISVHIQTPEEKRAQRDAADRHAWHEVDDLKSALVLHFGTQQIRFSTSTHSLQRAGRQIAEVQRAIDEGRHKIEPGKFARPTAWEKLDTLAED
jgi:hypothetical protein